MHKTAYEMRISDCSSDVCSSDLLARRERRDRIGEAGQRRGDAADPLRVAGVAHAQGKSRSRSDRISAVGIARDRPGLLRTIGLDRNRTRAYRTHAGAVYVGNDPGIVVIVQSADDPGEGRTAVRSQLKRSEEHTYELQSLMRNSYAVFCLKKKKKTHTI